MGWIKYNAGLMKRAVGRVQLNGRNNAVFIRSLILYIIRGPLKAWMSVWAFILCLCSPV
jgi:hypothetical protein